MMFDTGHAVAMRSPEGVEVLMHVGLDTVNLKGKHFKILAAKDSAVKKGDVLIEFDREGIKADGYDVITPVVVTNHEEFKSLEFHSGMTVAEGDEIITVKV
jgi:PTS system beta-glucosides-specific IIC component